MLIVTILVAGYLRRLCFAAVGDIQHGEFGLFLFLGIWLSSELLFAAAMFLTLLPLRFYFHHICFC